MGVAHYEQMGVETRAVHLKTKEEASKDDVLAALDGASMFFFCGGNPLHLARVLEGSPALDTIKQALAAGAAFAGCSAGAMVAGARAEGRGPAFWHVGLGLLPTIRFGVHWNRMPGFLPGLKEFLIQGGSRREHFIGIDEDTAILGDGESWRVFGQGGVDVRSRGTRARYTAGGGFCLA